MFEYQLIRSHRRKSLAIQVKHGKVVVRAPAALEQAAIDGFLLAKKSWVEAKISLTAEKQQATILKDGCQVWLLGQLRELTISFSEQENSINVKGAKVSINLTIVHKSYNEIALAQAIRAIIEIWLSEQANLYLPQRIDLLANKLRLTPQSYKIRRYKSRWGSCNSKGQLSFNYLLMMTPEWVIDYVIIHELCHLKHLNHSSAFWQLVSSFCPNTQQAKNWLKQHQSQLL